MPRAYSHMLFWLLCLAGTTAWSRADATRFDIEPQPLAAALNRFAGQAHMEVLYQSREVAGLESRGLHGDWDNRAALDQLLLNTGLHAVFSSETSATIRSARADVTTPAPDQSAPGSARPGAAGRPAAIPEELEEVTVSARRKDEELTQVPASITAYTADFLQKQNIQDFADYAMRIPNLTFQYGQGSSNSSTGFSGGRTTTIRGVAGENTTAFYIDDTPVPATISPAVLDLERIEVLKGPQGTLFGASSMGGNLRFITHKASLAENSYAMQLQGGATAGGGVDADAQWMADIVLVPDRVALNTAFGITRDSGYVTRRFPDADGQLTSRGGQGENEVGSATVNLRMRLTDALEATLGVMGQVSDLQGFPAAYVPLPAYRPVSYISDRDRDVQEFSRDKWGLASLTLNYAGPGFAVVSSSSYFDRYLREREDGTEGTNFFFTNDLGADLGDPVFYYINNVKERRATQEIRLSFDEGSLLPRLSGTVGLFYQHLIKTFENPPIPVPELSAAGFDPDYVVQFAAPSYENNSAVFGEFYYKIMPKLTATVGVREYRVQQKTDPYVITGVFNSPGGDLKPVAASSQKGAVPKAVLSYEVGDEGNVYASAAKGFRAGGAQALLPTFCSDDLAALGLTREGAVNYQPDTLWSYEVGAKSRLSQGRMHASVALFQIDWSHIQQNVLLPVCAFNFISNAGKARIRGGEMELSGKPVDGLPLSIQAGLGYTDGTLLDPGLINQAPDSRLTQVPQLTGTLSGFYEQPITGALTWFAAADFSYTGSVKVNDGSGGFVSRQPFEMLDANTGLRFGHSQLMLFAKNLLNEHLNLGDLYPISFERVQVLPDGGTQRLPRAAVSRPLQIGLQYRVSF